MLQLVSFAVDSDPLEPTEGADRYTSHVIFLVQLAQFIPCISHCVAQDEPPNVSVQRAPIPSSCHPQCVFDCLLVAFSFCPSPVSLSFTSSIPYPTCTLTSTSSPMSTASKELTTAPSHNEEYYLSECDS